MRFSQSEALEFHNHIADMLNDWFGDGKPAVLTDYFKAIKEYRMAVEEASEDNALFNELHAADMLVDEGWRGLKAQVLVACYHPEDDVKAAGEAVDAILGEFDNAVILPFSTEYAVISQALTELSKLPEALLERAGVDFWMDYLSVNFDKFMEIFAQRLQGVSDDVAANCRDKRLELNVAYKNIIEYVNALELIRGADVTEELVHPLNDYVGQKRDAYKHPVKD